MAGDRGLEELLNDDLRDEPGVTDKAMFGGWAWLVNGNLLCGGRGDGMLVRLGRDNDGWAFWGCLYWASNIVIARDWDGRNMHCL